MRLLLVCQMTVLFLSGCGLKPANPYPKYDSGDIGSIDTGQVSEPDSNSEPEDSPNDTGPDTDTDTGPDTDTDTGPSNPNAIEIYGTYAGLTGEYHYVGESNYRIDFGSVEKNYTYIVFNNAQRWVVASNDSQNGGEEVGKFSKFVWTIDRSNIVWVCQATAIAASATDAQNAPFPSVISMDTGCNGSAWWRLTRQ